MLKNFNYKSNEFFLDIIEDHVIMERDSIEVAQVPPLPQRELDILVKKNQVFLRMSQTFISRILDQIPTSSAILIFEKDGVLINKIVKGELELQDSFKVKVGVEFNASFGTNPIRESLVQGKIIVCERFSQCLSTKKYRTLIAIPIKDSQMGKYYGSLGFVIPHEDYSPLILQLFKLTCDLINLSLTRVADMKDVQNYFEQMFGSLAHEIKNMLTTIRGFVQLLSKCEPDNESSKEGYSKFILNELDRAHGILKNSIFYSTSTNHRVNVCKISDIIHDVLSNLHSTIINYNIELNLDVSPDIPAITGDSTQFRQVFLNIIQNAIESMPNGGTLSVICYFSNLQIYTSIKDTGVGMPANIRKKIFQPFFSTKHGGTGLGLSVSKQVIEQYKGQIYVTSSKNKGTSFTIILPT
ncbi:hypothetical protein HYG86_02415 [Alkalicella caledoniensis]|uniref:histidine kinase n=1 Tax=Alkalicella caledoniensis TaxID=2731377 RepID=A0A7G9W4S7_ALKCA|nr:ATP-binding protein [Alkalicella caledoniensis]QNO13689.1 hypothetical protein HYG86_02415 [Alkalicella caledoniensis]